MKNTQRRILCIDDDSDLLDSMQIILEGAGFAVERATSAEEGLKRFKAVAPDLVIVDLMMEEVDSGTSFVKEVRALRSDVPVYMLSSVGDGLNVTTDYARLGLTGVLQKPVNPQSLVSTLKTRLG